MPSPSPTAHKSQSRALPASCIFPPNIPVSRCDNQTKHRPVTVHGGPDWTKMMTELQYGVFSPRSLVDIDLGKQKKVEKISLLVAGDATQVSRIFMSRIVYGLFLCFLRRGLTSLVVAGEAVQVAMMGRSSKATAFMFNFIMVMIQFTTSPDLFSVFHHSPGITQELSSCH